MEKLLEHAGEGYEGLITREGKMAIAKLRLVGVYDDRQEGFFMLRTRIPGGRLTSRQARAIGEAAEEFSRAPRGAEDAEERFIEITTRQDIQLHWIRVESLPEIWRRYDAVGLTSLLACGHTTRNITCCPVSGIAADEVLDAHPLVAEANRFLLEHAEQGASLPRKFKIAITGARENCVLAQINDLAFTPAHKGGEVGFNVWAGGGLSDYPRLASPLGLFVVPGRVLETILACLELYRSVGDYKHEAINRFRMVVESMGPERVRDELAKRTGLTPGGGEDLMVRAGVDHLGVHPQGRPGLRYVGLNVPVGRMRGGELVEAAEAAERHGSGELRLTQRQNLILIDIPEDGVGALLDEPLARAYPPDPSPFSRGMVACTGAPFCKFGILETKRRGLELADYLDGAFGGGSPGGRVLTVHLSGCKASCAQPQLADIGLRSTVTKTEGGLEEAYDIGVGGAIDEGALAQWIAEEVPVPRALEGIRNIIGRYLSEGGPGEGFTAFVRRLGPLGVRQLLAGETASKGGAP